MAKIIFVYRSNEEMNVKICKRQLAIGGENLVVIMPFIFSNPVTTASDCYYLKNIAIFLVEFFSLTMTFWFFFSLHFLLMVVPKISKLLFIYRIQNGIFF
jgi:hypothetical protein